VFALQYTAYLHHEEVDSMNIVVFSCSLNPDSKSRRLAERAVARLGGAGVDALFIDLVQYPLPPCDGGKAYGDPAAIELKEAVKNASAAVLAFPVYNYAAGSALKNMMELTGDAWTGKTVGMMCAAGGKGSYMAPMTVANSLMLDFRCVIVPRFVYAIGADFEGDGAPSEELAVRVDELTDELLRIGTALARIS
jgi:NAD(P)H-dependent FMN reductase